MGIGAPVSMSMYLAGFIRSRSFWDIFTTSQPSVIAGLEKDIRIATLLSGWIEPQIATDDIYIYVYTHLYIYV